ncbi:MAG: leucine-rich repeat domain-containing protein [Treponema sp.]|jgi:hypothetical protein|nr:leucine-rich repeat domain-containing protein [Treponema sp.]
MSDQEKIEQLKLEVQAHLDVTYGANTTMSKMMMNVYSSSDKAVNLGFWEGVVQAAAEEAEKAKKKQAEAPAVKTSDDSAAIEQIKQEVKAHIDATFGPSAAMLWNVQISNPAAGTLAYWQSIKQSMLGGAPAQPPGQNSSGDWQYEMKDSSIVIVKYKGEDKEISIPTEIDGKPVTGIGERAFARKGLTKLTIPDSVTFIGYEAFARNEFTEVTIPGSISEIGEGAFERGKLTRVSFTDGVKTIGRKAFEANEIVSISFGSVEKIGDSAFRNNKLAGTFTIPDCVKSIGSSAFADNPFEIVIIPDGKIEINGSSAFGKAKIIKASDYAFESSNTHYTKPEDFKWRATNDGKGVIVTGFVGKAAELNIPPQIKGLPVVSIEKIGPLVKLTSVVIPDSVVSINSGTFSHKNIESITIGKGIKVIGSWINGNKNLTQVTIPGNVESIERSAFEDCGLTSVVIPNSVKSIGKDAFRNNALVEVTMHDGITYIGPGAFTKNKLKSVVIPKGVTYIAEGAFSNNALTSVTLHDGITLIEYCAFYENKLTGIQFPDSLKSIGQDAFRENNLKSVTIPDSVTTINKQAFMQNKLTSLTLGRGLKEIGSWAFGWNKFESLIIPENITSVGSVFVENDKLTCVAVPNHIYAQNGFFCMEPNGGSGCLKTSMLGNGGGDFKKNPNGPYQINHAKPHDAEVQAFHAKAAAQEQALKGTPLHVLYPLRPLDDAMNLSIAPKTDAGAVLKISKDSLAIEDVKACYAGLHRFKDIKAAANQLWSFQVENNFYSVTITAWKSEADAENALKSYDAKRSTRRGHVTARDVTVNSSAGEGLPRFKKGTEILRKEDILEQYKNKSMKVREIKPAGNWLWELELEDDDYIGIIIGWANNADAEKAENLYKSKPELQVTRRRNVTAYFRSSKTTASPFVWLTMAANDEDYGGRR